MSVEIPAKDRSFGLLVRELLRQLRKHKWLVIGIIATGLIQAALVKAPYLLLMDLSQILAPSRVPTENALHATFSDVRDGILRLFGLASLVPTGDPTSDGYKGAVVSSAAVILGVFAVLGAISMYAFRLLANLAAVRFVVDLRNRLCAKLMSLGMRFFSKQRTGELISAISNDTNTIRHSFNLLFENALLEPLFILVNVIFAWSVHPLLGAMVLVIVPFLVVPMSRLGKKVRKGSGKSLQALGDATDAMQQMFTGYRTVKAFQLEEREVAEFEAVNERFLRQNMRLVRAKAKSQALLYLIYMVGVALIIYSLHTLMASDDVNTSELALAMAAIGTTYTHVKRTARTYNLVKESQGAMDRLQAYELEEPEVRDEHGAIDLGKPRGEIEFRSVGFAYGDEPVLRELSFRVRPGEKIAFVGQSGSGKSTILNLLTRFYDPDAGSIVIDGKDLRQIQLDSYLQHVAIVDQQPFLFNTTIRENVMLGRPGCTEEEMRAACVAAYVDHFVKTLPDGYDTVVGERGSRLSGGQLQRITIARAIVRDPAILLLDEATGALDTESEKEVQVALDHLMRDRTSFLVAHRLSTVRGADRIYVIEDGRIVEFGNHDELMAREGSAYRRLRMMQA